MVKAIANGRFRFHGRWISRGESLDMTEEEFAEHSCSNAGAASNLVTREIRASEGQDEGATKEETRGRYNRRDMRARQ